MSISRLHEFAGKRVSVCGLMVANRINTATTGDLTKFVTLADHTGLVEEILFPDVYARSGYLTAAHPILAVTGMVKVLENRKGLMLRAQSVMVPLRVPAPQRH